MIALIPARGGSERIKGKNIKSFCGYPLLAYAIVGAHRSGLFNIDQNVWVSTDHAEIASVATEWGCKVIHRPAHFSHPNSPDSEWLKHAIANIDYVAHDSLSDLLFILRPTNPFRTAETIKRAAEQFDPWFDSMRAMSPIRDHPRKAWVIHGNRASRYQAGLQHGENFCDLPTQLFPPLWIQNGCLQICKLSTVFKFGNYTGTSVQAFETRGYEGINLDTMDDWQYAEWLVESGKAMTEVLGDRVASTKDAGERNGKKDMAGPKRRGRPRKTAAVQGVD